MTKNTWPDPTRPGWPTNPDQNRWHWVNGTPREWNVFDDGPSWRFAGCYYRPHEWADRIYQGACLTPDEAEALQARADQAALGHAREADRADLSEFLHKRDVEALQKRVAELEAENAALRNNKTEEKALREMMRDPRYWRQRNPEWVNKVTDGFRKLTGGKE